MAESLLVLYRVFASDRRAGRQRIDVTANWAIPLVMATATFALGNRALPHIVLLVLGGSILGFALVTDARRYRGLEHSNWRTRLLEIGYFAPRITGEDGESDGEWREMLAADLRRPMPRLGLWAATKVRLRATYLALTYLFVAAWVAKAVVHPQVSTDIAVVLARMGVGPVSGVTVASIVLGSLAILTVAVFRTPPTSHLEHEHRLARSARDEKPPVASPPART